MRALVAFFLFMPAFAVGLMSSLVFLQGIFTPYLSSMYGSDAMVEILLDETGTCSPAMASACYYHGQQRLNHSLGGPYMEHPGYF